MAGWDEILNEVGSTVSPFDHIRRKHIKALSEFTKRNTIVYYSAWLTKPNTNNSSINDFDMEGFMNAVKGLDCSKGLDLILHTPGGSPTAAEAIVTYLKSKFNKDIRVIVPQMAMSAGTMMACSSRIIIMGKHSSLGPIDPQFNGVPAYNIESEFKEAKEDLKRNPSNTQYWAIKLQQYPAAFLKTAIDAIQLSSTLVKEWLLDCMFEVGEETQKQVDVSRIVEALNNHHDSKVHDRHYGIEFCKRIGLKIMDLESDETLQDLVLSVHHSVMITLNSTPAEKIIENNEAKAFITNIPIQQS